MEVFFPSDRQDWNYDMRRDMQEILPGLFLGPYSSANKSKFDNLKLHGITHIICIRQPIDSSFIKINFPEDFRYMDLMLADSPMENIIRFFPQVKQFIDECLQSGGKVLVHGNAGISRSASFVIAYIMEKCEFTFKEAQAYVQSRRFCVGPNEGFTQQLREFEMIYRARLINNSIDPALTRNGSVKRKFEDDPDQDSEYQLDGSTMDNSDMMT